MDLDPHNSSQALLYNFWCPVMFPGYTEFAMKDCMRYGTTELLYWALDCKYIISYTCYLSPAHHLILVPHSIQPNITSICLVLLLAHE